MTVTDTPCPYSESGTPSVNHPGEWVVKPWQCVQEEGHDSPHAPVAACREPVRVEARDWPCIRALDHQGDHDPGEDSRWLRMPIREMDREEMIQSIGLLVTHLEAAKRDLREQTTRMHTWEHSVRRVATHALGGKSPHGNNHTPDCWRKHAACLAFAIIGSGGLEGAKADIARAQE